jgi:hypothetical protein
MAKSARTRELLDAAAVLLMVVADATAEDGHHAEDRRARILDLLRRSLEAHEARVLAGEITYSLPQEEGQQAAERVRHAASPLSTAARSFLGDALSLELGTAELASLLIRAAANIMVSGRAGEVPEQRPASLERGLQAIVLDLVARSKTVKRPLDGRADVVAHHFAAGLRVHVRQNAPDRLAAPLPRGNLDPGHWDSSSRAWIDIATHVYVAITALDDKLDGPAYSERFATLDAAIVEGASNVICGARLMHRPEQFRQPEAWRHQAVGLTYALEAYVAGLGGIAASFEQSQLIGLTRLVRAVAAIQLLRLCQAHATPSNGRAKQE